MRNLIYGRTEAESNYFLWLKITGASITNWGSNANTTSASEEFHWLYHRNLDVRTDFIGQYSTTWTHLVTKWDFSSMRALLGHAPVLLRGNLRVCINTDWGAGVTGTLYMARMDKSVMTGAIPTEAEMTWRYKKVTGSVAWTDDLYGPKLGVDFAGLRTSAYSPWLEWTFVGIGTWGTGQDYVYNKDFDLTELLRGGLLGGEVVWTYTYPRQESTVRPMQIAWCYNPGGGAGIKIAIPYWDVLYFLPLEFYGAKVDGTIDLAHPLDAYMGMDSFRLYLTAVQRGETGTTVKFFLRNFTSQTFKLVRIGDDVPEWSEPVQKSGTGAGVLYYPLMSEASVSQEYWIKFTSATAYDVKALKYRDNFYDLHASYGGSGWNSDITSTFTAPTGGLVIPPESWSLDGFATNDIFMFQVLGNTTDTNWPSDSNDQVEMTLDSGGTPDATKWRPVQGYSVKSSASVTIDATSKKIYTKPFVASQWPTGRKAFIGDMVPKVQHGAVSSVQEASLGSVTFTGTGVDDLSKGGNYRGNADRTYRVKIDGTGSPNTFTWSNDGGSTWEATGVNCATSWTPLEDGVYVKWTSATGHTNGDYWQFVANGWAITLESLTNNSDVFGIGSWVSTTLPWANAGAGLWSQATAAFGVSASNPRRIPVASPASLGFVTSDVIYLQDLDTSTNNETAVIATLGTSYIDVQANLTYDYVASSLVVKVGSGELALWARATATGITSEERKDLRINVRV